MSLELQVKREPLGVWKKKTDMNPMYLLWKAYIEIFEKCCDFFYWYGDIRETGLLHIWWKVCRSDLCTKKILLDSEEH